MENNTPKKWFAMEVKGDTAELTIFDEIGGWGINAGIFKSEFDLVKGASKINLVINSPGGSIPDGMAIYNILSSVKEKLCVEVVGLAASMASIIALAGKELVMNDGAFLMIHNPWTVAAGDSEELQKTAEVLDLMKGEMVKIYGSKTALLDKEISQMMDDETWLTADQAIELGFADSKRQSAQLVASSNFPALSKFRKTPEVFGIKKEPAASQPLTIKEEPTMSKESATPQAEQQPESSPQVPQAAAVQPPVDADKIAEMVMARMAPMFSQGRITEPLKAAETEEVKEFKNFLKTRLFQGTLQTTDVAIPTTISAQIFERASELSLVRRIGIPYDPFTPNVQIPILPAASAFTIQTESANFPDVPSTPTSKTLAPRRLVGKLTATEQAVKSGQDILGMFVRDAARKLAAAENKYFINGNFAASPAEPEGILTGGVLGKTAAGASAITVADIQDFFFSIDQVFLDDVVWIMNQAVYKAIIKLTDASGRYLFMPETMYGDIPRNLIGRPVFFTNELTGTISTGAKTAVLVSPQAVRLGSFGGLQTRTQISQLNGSYEYILTHYYDSKVLDTAGAKWLAQA